MCRPETKNRISCSTWNTYLIHNIRAVLRVFAPFLASLREKCITARLQFTHALEFPEAAQQESAFALRSARPSGGIRQQNETSFRSASNAIALQRARVSDSLRSHGP